MFQFRPYQAEAIESVFKYFETARGNPLVVLPTATGKSVVQAAFIKRAIETWPEQNILCLTHVKELISQNYLALKKMWPEADAGIYSSGLGKRDIAKVTFAGIQSIHTLSALFQHKTLIIIDEAHLVGLKSSGMYRKFLNEMPCKVVGLTATPFRMTSGYLHEGDDRLFTDICCDYSALNKFNSLVDDGYLCPLVTKATEEKLDVSDVKVRMGEFISSDLSSAVDREAVTRNAVREIIQKGGNRKKWLIFAIDIDHAEHIVTEMQSQGIDAAAVHSKMTNRDGVLDDFKHGELRCVVNVNVLTTGFDHPGIDLIALLRPTASPGLHVQMIGRGLRILDGKADCLVLDFAGNTGRLGPINDVHVRKKGERIGKGAGGGFVRECPDCSSLLHIKLQVCPNCGHKFPIKKLKSKAYTDEVIRRDAVTELRVNGVRYHIHRKPGSPPSLKVSYQCGLRVFSEWICLEHKGYALQKAVGWWLRRANKPVPQTVADAKARSSELLIPSTIKVNTGGRYPNIIHYDFDKAA